MDVLISFLTRFIEAIWSATDPFGVAFGILGTYGFRSMDDAFKEGDPIDKTKRTIIQRILPVIPVCLGISWVVMYELVFGGNLATGAIFQRAIGTGCSALALHKIWWHTIKNT